VAAVSVTAPAAIKRSVGDRNLGERSIGRPLDQEK
jgi:hypothetical protein